MKILKIIHSFIPPPQWRIAVFFSLGVLAGLLFLVLHLAKATSYLSDKPETCVNCHVMAPQYATWQKGSHGRVTVCNDCHVPQDNFIKKYFFKSFGWITPFIYVYFSFGAAGNSNQAGR